MNIKATLAGGRKITLPSPASIAVDAAYDIPADAFEAVFPAEKLLDTGEFISLTAELDGKIIFDGLADEQRLIKNKDGLFLRLQARSRAGMLLDNEAIPQTFYRARLTDIYNAACGQYGFAGVLYDKNPTLSSFTVAKGQSEWQALESFCRQALELRPYIENNYVVARRRRAQGRLLISNTAAGGLRFSSLAVCNSRYGIISKVILKNAATGVYDTAVYNPRFNELNLRRKRYIAPPKDWSGDPKRGADRLMRDSMLKKVLVTAELTGLVYARPGDAAVIADTAARGIEGELTVFAARHTADENGSFTTLTLILPDYL